jgi:hypothetical protein
MQNERAESVAGTGKYMFPPSPFPRHAVDEAPPTMPTGDYEAYLLEGLSASEEDIPLYPPKAMTGEGPEDIQ